MHFVHIVGTFIGNERMEEKYSGKIIISRIVVASGFELYIVVWHLRHLQYNAEMKKKIPFSPSVPANNIWKKLKNFITQREHIKIAIYPSLLCIELLHYSEWKIGYCKATFWTHCSDIENVHTTYELIQLFSFNSVEAIGIRP